jgi:Ricin-type beta-trefoil lectin domain-like/Putative Ig domain
MSYLRIRDQWTRLQAGRRLTVVAATAAAGLTLAALVGVEAVASAAPSNYEICVVPTGGTQPAGCNQVVSTLSAAKTAVEQNNGSGSVTVELATGTYSLTSPLSLGAADGGQNGDYVTWEAAPSAQPVISGSEQVTSWSVYNSGQNIYQANVGVGTNTRNLYVNGVEEPIAGSPIGGSAAINSSYLTPTSSGFTINNSALQSQLDALPDQSQIEIEHRGVWTDHYCPVSSISGNALKMAQPCWENNTMGWDTGDTSSGDYIENSLGFLNEANEWYLDSQTGVLYYEAPSGTNMSSLNVQLPLAQSLLDISGSYSSPVQNLTFRGIHFTGTSWLAPSSSTGYADQQQNYFYAGTDPAGYPSFGSCTGGCSQFEATRGSWNETPGAIQVSAASGVTFAGDTFSDLGSAALGIGEDADANTSGVGLGAQNITVANSTFSQIAATGIMIGGIQSPNASQPTNSQAVVKNVVVENNNISATGTNYLDSDGVQASYTTHAVITNNVVDNAPYDGIETGFGWGAFDPGGSQDYSNRGMYNYYSVPTTATPQQYTQVTNNVIYSTGLGTGSFACCAGPFYNLSADPFGVVSGNYMYSNNPAQGGLYGDEGTRFITFENNVIQSATSWVGINSYSTNNSDDNVFFSNWYNNNATVNSSTGTGSPHYNVVYSNTSVSGTSWPTAASQVISSAGVASGLGYPAPTITTLGRATMTVGSAGTYTLFASGSPTPSYAETGALPSGVTFADKGNGTATLSGTPASGSAGTYPISITASNGSGSAATQAFLLTVTAQSPTSTTEIVTGRVTNASTGLPLSGVAVSLYINPTTSTALASATTSANGSYEMDGVVPGALALLDTDHYLVKFVDSAGTVWYNGTPAGAPTEADANAIQLEGRLDSAVTGINAVMSAAGGYPTGYNKLVIGNDSLCLDGYGDTSNAGAIIDQWTCSGQTNQEFQFVPTSGGFGELEVENSGQDVTVLNSSTSQGVADIVQEPVNGNAASQWLPEQQSDGSYEFKNDNSGLCLDVDGGGSNLGQQLDQWPCKNAPGTNQDFTP